jgi:hypothetical protein
LKDAISTVNNNMCHTQDLPTDDEAEIDFHLGGMYCIMTYLYRSHIILSLILGGTGGWQVVYIRLV